MQHSAGQVEDAAKARHVGGVQPLGGREGDRKSDLRAILPRTRRARYTAVAVERCPHRADRRRMAEALTGKTSDVAAKNLIDRGNGPFALRHGAPQ